MNIIGADFIQQELKKPGYLFKMIFNDSGAAFFSASIQHRTVKLFGLSYEDSPKGNALAAIVTDGRIEIGGEREGSERGQIFCWQSIVRHR